MQVVQARSALFPGFLRRPTADSPANNRMADGVFWPSWKNFMSLTSAKSSVMMANFSNSSPNPIDFYRFSSKLNWRFGYD
jgi:hypothetical protein